MLACAEALLICQLSAMFTRVIQDDRSAEDLSINRFSHEQCRSGKEMGFRLHCTERVRIVEQCLRRTLR